MAVCDLFCFTTNFPDFLQLRTRMAMRYGWICGSTAYLASLFSQIQFAGVLCGTFSFGAISDVFGRRPVAIFAMTMGILTNFVTGLAPTWRILMAIRFFVGLSVGGTLVVGVARLIMTLICMAFPEWRASSIACALTALPALLILIFIFPESPTWLNNKGRLEEMRTAERYIAKFAHVEYKPVTLCEMLQTKSLHRRLFCLWTMWFVASICGYATDLNSNTISGDFFFNQIIYSILIALSKMVLVAVDTFIPSFSRRLLHQGAQTVVCLCFLILFFLTMQGYSGIATLIINVTGTIFIEYTWDACYLCAVESMETSCRASATGTCSLMARVGAIIAPVLTYANVYWPPALYLAVVIAGLVNLVVSYFFLVETKNVNLDSVTLQTDPSTEELVMLDNDTLDYVLRCEPISSDSVAHMAEFDVLCYSDDICYIFKLFTEMAVCDHKYFGLCEDSKFCDGEISKNCTIFNECRENLVLHDDYFKSAALEFGWICSENAYMMSLFSQLQFFGVLLGTLTFGSLSDMYGRKPISLLALSTGFLSNLMTGFASTWQILLLLRFVVGLSIGGAVTIKAAYVTELVLPQQRMVIRGVFNWVRFKSGGGVVRIALTLVCMMFPDWRTSSIACAIAMLPAIFSIAFIFPESPTWLHNKGRLEEMKAAEQYIARFAGEKYEPVQHKPIEHVKTLCEVWRTRGIFRRLIVLWMMWFVAALCSYGSDLNSNTIYGNLFVNQILFGVLIMISKLILLGVDTWFPGFSRRQLHQGAQLVVCLCFLILSILTMLQYTGWAVLIVNLLGTVFNEYTWDACFLCTVESLETSCRASGTGSCSLMARIGAILAPVLTHMNNFWPPSVYVTIFLVGSINFILSNRFLVRMCFFEDCFFLFFFISIFSYFSFSSTLTLFSMQ
ncbi:hypothetical protein GCK32_005974 [Trichostrongylus colubriformis]|uniref:Major facilitator superfamily (MFS) profile domain-containing protein n=1 Tax=Trichostrongylus colubriformis TaxID=6319 RepID=A0AAN8FQJ9_TRICO